MERSISSSKSSKSYSALLLTAFPVLGFPQALGEALLSQPPLEPSSCGGQMVIPCSKVLDLLDPTMSFLGGQGLVLR